MAESKEAAPEAEAPPKKKGKLVAIVIYLVATIVLLGAGTAAGVLVVAPKLAPPPPPEGEADGGSEHGAAGKDGHAEPGKDDGKHPPAGDAKPAAAGDAHAAPAAAAADNHGAAPGAVHGPSFVTLPPLVVNVSQEKSQRFLRLTLAVEVADAASEALLKKNVPKAVDAIQIYLRTQAPESFTRVGTLMQIRSDLLQRIRQIDPGIDAKGVLFQDLMVQ